MTYREWFNDPCCVLSEWKKQRILENEDIDVDAEIPTHWEPWLIQGWLSDKVLDAINFDHECMVPVSKSKDEVNFLLVIDELRFGLEVVRFSDTNPPDIARCTDNYKRETVLYFTVRELLNFLGCELENAKEGGDRLIKSGCAYVHEKDLPLTARFMDQLTKPTQGA